MDDREVWHSLVRTIAWESGAWVISVCGFTRRVDYPEDLSVVPPDGPDVFTRGGTMIVSPDGEVIAGPLWDEEGTLIADCDLRQTVRAKYGFDAVGHYSREDVLVAAIESANDRAETAEPSSLKI
jgi:predicted amidohydrolase